MQYRLGAFKLKILVVCQYYYPEPFRINDYCEELVKRGHEITVVTGTPNYPMGEIYEGYRYGKKTDEVVNGVTVHRCSIVGRKTGAIHRFVNYYSYVISSKKYIDKLDGSYDVVFVNQLSPVMMAKAGIKYKRRFNKKLVLYCLDLWPESLVAGGIQRSTVIYKIYHKVSEKIYKQADKILISSKSFSKYFKNEFSLENVEYLPQYAEDLFTPKSCLKEPDNFIDLMFAGNVGYMQDVITIIKAAQLTKGEKEIRWHIVGDGTELDSLIRQSEGLDNVIFHGRIPLEGMPDYYRKADAMIVTMKDDPFISMTTPGKVQSYMAAGKPIIACMTGEGAKIIQEAACGVVIDAGDVAMLAKVAKSISCNREKLVAWGNASRAYFENHFTKDQFMNVLENCLKNFTDEYEDFG